MAWKQIGKNKYFYLSKREGGRVVSRYFGRGEAGELMAQLKRLNREADAEQRSKEHVERETADRVERRIAAWHEQIETMATGAMLAAGHHRHHGQWRRRRNMTEIEIEIASEASLQATAGTNSRSKLTWDEFSDLVRRAEDGDAKSLLHLREALHSGNYPEWLKWFQDTRGNPAVLLRTSLASRLGGRGNQIRMQAAESTMNELRLELEGPDATPMERLLTERAVLSWFTVNVYEILFAESKNLTIRESELHLRKIDSAHKRFLTTMATLARIRKLALPSVQVNIARNQLNVAHVEEVHH